MFTSPSKDLLVVLVIVLLIFGPKRLPGLGRSLGQGIKEFKDSVTGGEDHDDDQPPARLPAANAPVAREPAVPVVTAEPVQPVATTAEAQPFATSEQDAAEPARSETHS